VAKPGSRTRVGAAGPPGPSETRQALIGAAVDALKEEGYAGASAREIARRAGCNQGLVFYHFGSVANLLLAALDAVSETRRAQYQAAVDRAQGLGELVDAAEAIFEEDLHAGHIAVLAELIAGASTTPGLAPEVAARIAPWRSFAADAVGATLAGSPLAALVEPDLAAHAIVALYLGLEMLAHLDGDRSAALTLFDRARRLALLAEGLGAGARSEPSGTGPEKEKKA
jgi:AcrR family transcriptional regulator